MRRTQRLTAVVAAGAALSLSTAITLVATAQAAPPGQRHTLADSHPRWATPGTAQGAVAGSTPVTARVYLAPRGGQAKLDSFVTAVSTPGSASYQQFLTASQYHERFDPSRATVAAVTRYLTSNGLTVTGIERFHTYLTVQGKAAAADRAFDTTLTRYLRGGTVVQAPASDLKLPEQIRSQVLGVTGLDTATNRAHPASPTPLPPPEPGYTNARPCSLYSGQVQATDEGDYSTPLPPFEGKRLSYAVCGFVPSQLRGAYGVQNAATGAVAHDGTGQTIAIVDAYAAPKIPADADEYSTRQGEPTFTAGQFSQVVPTGYTDIAACDPAGWYGEETLDVEAEHAMAPGAAIRYYGAASCDDPDLNAALRQVVDDDVASIVSNSYGDLESGQDAGSVVAFESIAKQAAVEGIGIDFSSGDDGDEQADSGFVQPDYPASDPYVTTVGGTSTGIGSAGTRIYQTGWGTDRIPLTDAGTWSDPEQLFGGSGGGYSDLFPRPAYQLGVVPSSNTGSRAVPDIAADADPNTGMLIGETQTFTDGVRYGEYRVGGTSVSSPLSAGMLADVQQAVGHRLGFANPLLYALAGAGSKGLTDVLPQASSNAPLGVVRVDYVDDVGFDPAQGYRYTVRTFDQDSSLVTTKGWDDVTGLGTPNVPGLIRSIRALG